MTLISSSNICQPRLSHVYVAILKVLKYAHCHGHIFMAMKMNKVLSMIIDMTINNGYGNTKV